MVGELRGSCDAWKDGGRLRYHSVPRRPESRPKGCQDLPPVRPAVDQAYSNLARGQLHHQIGGVAKLVRAWIEAVQVGNWSFGHGLGLGWGAGGGRWKVEAEQAGTRQAFFPHLQLPGSPSRPGKGWQTAPSARGAHLPTELGRTITATTACQGWRSKASVDFPHTLPQNPTPPPANHSNPRPVPQTDHRPGSALQSRTIDPTSVAPPITDLSERPSVNNTCPRDGPR